MASFGVAMVTSLSLAELTTQQHQPQLTTAASGSLAVSLLVQSQLFLLGQL